MNAAGALEGGMEARTLRETPTLPTRDEPPEWAWLFDDPDVAVFLGDRKWASPRKETPLTAWL